MPVEAVKLNKICKDKAALFSLIDLILEMLHQFKIRPSQADIQTLTRKYITDFTNSNDRMPGLLQPIRDNRFRGHHCIIFTVVRTLKCSRLADKWACDHPPYPHRMKAWRNFFA